MKWKTLALICTWNINTGMKLYLADESKTGWNTSYILLVIIIQLYWEICCLGLNWLPLDKIGVILLSLVISLDK